MRLYSSRRLCRSAGVHEQYACNGDGVVDVSHLSIVSVAYGTFEGQPGYDPDVDINKDGLVDMRDLAVVSLNYGNSCL